MNPKVQEAIDTMLDRKAALVKEYYEVREHLITDPEYAQPILFDIEEELEEINEKYSLLMGYVTCQK